MNFIDDYYKNIDEQNRADAEKLKQDDQLMYEKIVSVIKEIISQIISEPRSRYPEQYCRINFDGYKFSAWKIQSGTKNGSEFNVHLLSDGRLVIKGNRTNKYESRLFRLNPIINDLETISKFANNLCKFALDEFGIKPDNYAP